MRYSAVAVAAVAAALAPHAQASEWNLACRGASGAVVAHPAQFAGVPSSDTSPPSSGGTCLWVPEAIGDTGSPVGANAVTRSQGAVWWVDAASFPNPDTAWGEWRAVRRQLPEGDRDLVPLVVGQEVQGEAYHFLRLGPFRRDEAERFVDGLGDAGLPAYALRWRDGAQSGDGEWPFGSIAGQRRQVRDFVRPTSGVTVEPAESEPDRGRVHIDVKAAVAVTVMDGDIRIEGGDGAISLGVDVSRGLSATGPQGVQLDVAEGGASVSVPENVQTRIASRGFVKAGAFAVDFRGRDHSVETSEYSIGYGSGKITVAGDSVRMEIGLEGRSAVFGPGQRFSIEAEGE